MVALPKLAGRKVRAPEGRVLGNAQGCQGRPWHYGKGHRNQTAEGSEGDQARVKRWGKSPPGSGVTRDAGNPHPEQGQTGGIREWPAPTNPRVGRREVSGNRHPREMTTTHVGTELGLQNHHLPHP